MPPKISPPSIYKQGFGKITEVSNDKLIHVGYHYNSSIIRLKGKLFMVYRAQQLNGHSSIAVSELDENYQAISNKILETPFRLAGYHSEDPRVFSHKGKIHVAYGAWSGSWQGYLPTQVLVMYDDNWEYAGEIPLPFRENGGRTTEKSWQFFTYEEDLYFVYWIKPHIIVKVKDGTCEVVAEINPELQWSYGTPRGGAPPVRIGDYFYHWFHSALDEPPRRRYYMGLYVFEAKPPFKPIAYTPFPLLSASDEDKPLDWAPRVIFPNGALYEEGNWIISAGIHDHYNVIIEVSQNQVLPKLIKVGRNLEKQMRLKDVNKGIPGGFVVKLGNLVLSASNWNALVQKAQRYDIPESVLHQHLSDKVAREDRVETWV